jgi:hypothetical protein
MKITIVVIATIALLCSACAPYVGPSLTSTGTIHVTSVTIYPAAVEMIIGGATESVYAYALPFNATNRTIIYSSSNPSFATVDSSGTITAVGSGTATIYATADGIAGTCVVTAGTLSATVTIDSIQQTYYSSLNMYDSYVTIYFTLKNTGTLSISHATIYLKATCDDGTTSLGTGYVFTTIPPGASTQDDGLINVNSKHAATVISTSQTLTH